MSLDLFGPLCHWATVGLNASKLQLALGRLTDEQIRANRKACFHAEAAITFLNSAYKGYRECTGANLAEDTLEAVQDYRFIKAALGEEMAVSVGELLERQMARLNAIVNPGLEPLAADDREELEVFFALLASQARALHRRLLSSTTV